MDGPVEYHAVDCTLYFLKGVCCPLDRFANKLRRNVSEAVRATHTVTKKEVHDQLNCVIADDLE